MRAIHKRLNPEWEYQAGLWAIEYRKSHMYMMDEDAFLKANIPPSIENYITTEGEMVAVDYKEFTCVLLDDKGSYHKCLLSEVTAITDAGNISDGYHTFNELYEYRLLYNAAFFNMLHHEGLFDVHKAKLHSDGEVPFGDPNWFVVVAELPEGQISNHYEMKDWDLFKIPEKARANEWDGHTPQDVAKRVRKFLES